MLVQVVYLEVKPEFLQAFLDEARANVLASLQEQGVAQFDLLQDQDEPLHLLLYEVYLSEEATEAHRKTPHYKRWSDVALPMLATDRIRTVYRKIAPIS